MAERTGKIISFNPINRLGEIRPQDGGPAARFYLPAVTNADPQPKAGDTALFDAPEVRKNKQGKVIQGDASSVTITERAPDRPVRAPENRDATNRRFSKNPNGRRAPGDRGRDNRNTDRRNSADRSSVGRNTGERNTLSPDRQPRDPSNLKEVRRERRPSVKLLSSKKFDGNQTDRNALRSKRPRAAQGEGSQKLVKNQRTLSGILPLSGVTADQIRNAHPVLLLDRLFLWSPALPPKAPATPEITTSPTETASVELSSQEAPVITPESEEKKISEFRKESLWRYSDRHRDSFLREVFLGSFQTHSTKNLPYHEFVERRKKMMTHLELRGYVCENFRLRFNTPFSSFHFSPFEGSLSSQITMIHPQHGYPIFPGTLLKGFLRRSAELFFGENFAEINKILSESVILDSLPGGRLTRLKSVERYAHVRKIKSSEPKTLREMITSDPRRTSFTAVQEGASFLSTIAFSQTVTEQQRDLILSVFKKGLENLGIGSGSAVGMGAVWAERLTKLDRVGNYTEPAAH
jgi:CRISPR/Cas system CMR subunit Cmr6 (Cas7 group RAMP superfamily)